jgi:hypothetical protein
MCPRPAPLLYLAEHQARAAAYFTEYRAWFATYFVKHARNVLRAALIEVNHHSFLWKLGVG